MKKLFTLLALCACLYLPAQTLVLELQNVKSIMQPVFNSNEGLFYVNRTNNIIDFYDGDFKFVKQVNFFPKNKGGVSVFENYFTKNNGLEYLAQIAEVGADDYPHYILYNESGRQLLDFGAKYHVGIYGVNYCTSYTMELIHGEYWCNTRVYKVNGMKQEPAEPCPECKECEPCEICKECEECEPCNPDPVTVYRQTNQGAYPVPAASAVHISYPAGNNQELQVYNQNGACIARQPLEPGGGTYTLDVSGFAPGNYIYTVGSQKGKFIVQ